MQTITDLRFTTSLKIVYSLTLGGVATWYLFFYLSYCLGNLGGTGDNIFSLFLRYLPFLFAMSALPLAIFTLVFLTKGGGIDHFRSFNAGKKLTPSALAIIIGYIFVIFQPNTSATRGYAPNHYDFYYTYFGLILIAAGFASLLILYKRNTSSINHQEVPKKKGRKTRIVMVLTITILAITTTSLVTVNNRLQMENDCYKENLEHQYINTLRLVNEQWTNNIDNNQTYVNYKGGLCNIGYRKTCNVTVIVHVSGTDYNILAREEFHVGELDYMQYQEIDLNIVYSGELSDVSAGYSYDILES